MITKSQFLNGIYTSCRELTHDNKPTDSLKQSLIRYLYDAGTIFDEANVNKNPNGGVEYLDDSEYEVAMQKIGDYYEKNIYDKLEEPSENITNEEMEAELIALGEIEANYNVLSKAVARQEEKEEESETSFKELYNGIKSKVDEVDNNYGLQKSNESNIGYTLDNYIKKLVRICKNSSKLSQDTKMSFLEKAIGIFTEVNKELTPNYTGKQVLDENEAKDAAVKLTALWNEVSCNKGEEHKDCHGKYDLLFKAIEDDSDKDYTNDYCYEDIGSGNKVKWTMKAEITPDFSLSSSVKPDQDNIAIFNGRAVKQK